MITLTLREHIRISHMIQICFSMIHRLRYWRQVICILLRVLMVEKHGLYQLCWTHRLRILQISFMVWVLDAVWPQDLIMELKELSSHVIRIQMEEMAIQVWFILMTVDRLGHVVIIFLNRHQRQRWQRLMEKSTCLHVMVVTMYLRIMEQHGELNRKLVELVIQLTARWMRLPIRKKLMARMQFFYQQEQMEKSLLD